jgi:hypothetical protein
MVSSASEDIIYTSAFFQNCRKPKSASSTFLEIAFLKDWLLFGRSADDERFSREKEIVCKNKKNVCILSKIIITNNNFQQQ